MRLAAVGPSPGGSSFAAACVRLPPALRGGGEASSRPAACAPPPRYTGSCSSYASCRPHQQVVSYRGEVKDNHRRSCAELAERVEHMLKVGLRAVRGGASQGAIPAAARRNAASGAGQ